MRRFYIVLLASLIVGSRASAQPSLPNNGIAAIVNGTVITYHEVQELALVMIDTFPRPLLTSSAQMAEYNRHCDEAFKVSLENLVEKQLILEDFKNAGGQIPANLLDDEVQKEVRKRFGDRVTAVKSLNARGMRYDDFRQQERDRIVLEVMRHRKITQPVVISPQKIERYYQGNLAKFQVGDEVKLRVIVLNAPVASMAEDVQALGQEILRKLADGVDFAEMASVYSEGSQRAEGGDWGWQDRKFLKKGLSDLAFALKVGAHSGVLGEATGEDQSYWILQYDPAGKLTRGTRYSVKDELLEQKTFDPGQPAPATPNKFYLIHAEDQRAARTRPIEEVRDEVEKTLLVQERSRLQKRYVERLRSKAFVTYFGI